MIVVLIVWLMFAILGVSLFSGKFGRCRLDFDGEGSCISGGGSWVSS